MAGCGRREAGARTGGGARDAEAVYAAPPQPDSVRLEADEVVVSGRGAPGAEVRLARPTGESAVVKADATGRWTIRLGRSDQPRIFGLSVTEAGRVTQAQGYLLVSPKGQAAILRSGAGALRIDAPAGSGLRAIDFDAGGGVEVAAAAPPAATVIVRLDGRQVALGRADDAGHYEASLPPAGQPAISRGPHQLQVSIEGEADTVAFVIAPPQPLADGPFRSQLTPAGLKVDWMTPGGGLQSTILVH